MTTNAAVGDHPDHITYTTTADSKTWTVTSICPRCGGAHTIEKCPQVKAIEYRKNGSIKRVEYMTPGDYLPKQADDKWRDPIITITTNSASWTTDAIDLTPRNIQ